MRRIREAVLVAAGGFLLAIVMTWPIAARMGKMGRVDSTDAMYAMWNVAWVAKTLTSNPLGVFDANIFYPHKRTLAFSESNLLTGAFGVPAWLITRNVYATYNSVTLIGFALAFICAYGLVRYLTGNRFAAVIAGIGFAFCPYVYARFPHIQLQMTFGMPLSLLALHALVDKPTWRRGAALGLALVAQGLTCAYYGILAGMMVGVGVLFFAFTRRQWKSKDYWAAVTVALVTCFAIIIPAFLPYLSIQEAGFQRTLEEAQRYSFGWQSWLASSVRSHAWLLEIAQRYGRRDGVLFPGVLLTLAGSAGLLLPWLRRFRASGYTAEIAGFYGALAVLGLWLSFGPSAGLFTVMYYTVPVFRLLRAPERFAIGVMLALAVGAGLFINWAWSRLRAREVNRRATLALAAALFAFAIADTWIAPLRFRPALPVASPYRMLARLDPRPTAEFPFFYRPIDLNRHAEYMFFSTYHWQPMINGYSDHMPKDFLDTVDPLSEFPADPAWPHLRDRGVRYVVVHLNYYHHLRRPLVEQGLAHYTAKGVLRFLDREGDIALYQIVRYP